MSEPEIGCCHVGVQMNNKIIVFGGFTKDKKPIYLDKTWVYNIYTEQWRKHVIPTNTIVPPRTMRTCAVAIGPHIYMFGGIHSGSVTNDLWTLSRMSEGCFNWSKIEFQDHVKLPSPRERHSGWQYAECLWVFGGYGAPSIGYLNDHEDFANLGFNNQQLNNQLLCYNPLSHSWTNPPCFGATPSPQWMHCTTTMMHQVWLYGGKDAGDAYYLNDLFELNMLTYTWTQIQINMKKPGGRCLASLNAISGGQLILHGGYHCKDTWVMDLASQTWAEHTVRSDPAFYCHAAFVGVNKCVIIIGKRSGLHDHESECTTFYVRLEPKSLQQLAMQMIYAHSTVLPWKHLPSKLIAQLEISENEDISS